ncbi:sensor domain-containing diguanylate cyclase [Billgrantia kenyensis]|uniref:diguanylate cyclase n=1 Tax=Billgrantia kenyensis TaxID=321266 RepID=A0A7V9W1J8_9GAMM|nr:diguanylate cyclase [Halomonas kenyensis]MBA2779356.1 diguanylate cyclase [Halomonas kenyensis]MCG6662496.1 diguanylate cyclase [Halomonas kenyensis]
MSFSLERELEASLSPSVPASVGTVQPHGCLIAFDSDWQGICLVSANLYPFFGLAPAKALGRPPETVLGAKTATALASALAKGAPGVTIPSGRAASQSLYASTHTTGQHVILEVEPQAGESHELPGLGYAWGARIAQAGSVDELHAQLLRAMHVLSGFETCMLSSSEHGMRSMTHCTNAPLMMIDSQARPVELLATPGPLPDLSSCPLCLPPSKLRPWLTRRQARAALILGLQKAAPGRRMVVCHDRQPRHLDPPRRHLLLQLVQLAALREALLQEKQTTRQRYRILHQRNTRLQWLANTDPLTRIANRHRIEQLLETKLAMSHRNSSPLALLLFDVDHFKQINDLHGHEAGDRVLFEVAQRAQAQLRDSDHLGRWGGEEFVVVVPDCDLAQAQELAWRLCHALARHPIEPAGPVTASFGVTVSQSGDTSRKLVQRADLAMYRAKRAGRACVRTQDTDP